MIRYLVSLVLLVVVGCGCCSLLNLPGSPPPFAPTSTSTLLPPRETPLPDPEKKPTPLPEITIDHVQQVNKMLEASSEESWIDTVSALSGAVPVYLKDESVTITTRLSPVIFSEKNNSPAFDYLILRTLQLAPARWMEIDPYPFESESGSEQWKNLVITIPGSTKPEEEILLVAHMDSATFGFDPKSTAPGADDNASGTAALVEALAVLSQHSFARTIKIIFFSGEEFGLLGSQAYVEDHDIKKVIAVINLDVISYDPNDDQCVDLHVGTLRESDYIGKLMMDIIDTYSLDLQAEYLTLDAISASDHASFWEKEIGAVMLSANLTDGSESSMCEPIEFNPYMHTEEDTVSNINPETGYELTRLAIITTIELAELIPGE